MMAEEKIREELEFQKSEYDRLRKMVDKEEMSELSRQEICGVMGRHAARIQVFHWILFTS